MPLFESAPSYNHRLIQKARELVGRNGSKIYSPEPDSGRRVIVTRGWSGRYVGRSTKIFVIEEALKIPGKDETVHPSHGVEIISFPLARGLRSKVVETVTPMAVDSWGNFVEWNNGINNKNRDSIDKKVKLKTVYQPSIQEYFDILFNEGLVEITETKTSKDEKKKSGEETATKFKDEVVRLVKIGWSKVPEDTARSKTSSYINVKYKSYDTSIAIESYSEKSFTVNYRAISEDHHKKFTVTKERGILVARQIIGGTYEDAIPATKFECDELIRDLNELTEGDYRDYFF